MSQGGRIRSRNILQHGRFRTSVNGMFGGQECGCLGGGGSRTDWIWRGAKERAAAESDEEKGTSQEETKGRE